MDASDVAAWNGRMVRMVVRMHQEARSYDGESSTRACELQGVVRVYKGNLVLDERAYTPGQILMIEGA